MFCGAKIRFFAAKSTKKSHPREENGFVVIGRIPLLAELCLPAGLAASRVNGACPVVGKALPFPHCFAS